MENQKIRKELPYSVTKNELVSMYLNQFSELKIRRRINEILVETGFSKMDYRIPHLPFMEFVDTYGVPKGYFITDND